MPAPKTMTRTISPVIASRCRRKRVRAYDHWLRAFISRPASTVESTMPLWRGGSTSLTCAMCGFSTPSGCSVITNPRIEIAVENVGDQVEEDDDRRRDDEIGHHGVYVEL